MARKGRRHALSAPGSRAVCVRSEGRTELPRSFSLRLRGVAPLTYTVTNGRLELDSDGRVECTMTADPQTFLLVGIGVVSQLRAAMTGKLRAGGRKPWLGLAFPRLFPPFPHGGVDR